MATAAGFQLEAGRIPGERIATELITSDSSSSTGSEVEAASIEASVVEGRTYRVTLDGAIGSDSAARVFCRFREDTASGTVILSGNVYAIDGDASGARFHMEGEYTADVTEQKTIVVTIERRSGTDPVLIEATSPRITFLYVDYIRG